MPTTSDSKSTGLVRHALCATILSASISGCGTPTKPAPPEAPPAVITLQEHLQQASKAVADGSRDRARDSYRAAAKAYPASKEPWLRLSEDYFESADYGNAILAAQEVLQRDTNDTVAGSILAVSGLRVSVASLQSLRPGTRMAPGTRTEAEIVARTLRDVLGEPVLVPSGNTAASSDANRPRVRARIPPVAKPLPGAAPAPATAAPASQSPFDKLK